MNGYKAYKWKRENTLKGNVPNKPGIYRFYNKDGALLYVGHASRLRHRIQSYGEQDDFSEHPTKPHLRGKIYVYAYKVIPIQKARELERAAKKRAKFNFK